MDAPDPAVGFTYTMRADLDEMPGFAAWVENVVARIGASTARLYAVQLCLEELVVNVILHAVPLATTPLAVDVCVRARAPAVQVIVEDNGAPFDPTQAASPDFAPDLPSATVGGRGLMLVRKFAQALTYSRIGERNRVVLDFTG